MKFIDPATWARRAQYQLFRTYANPHFSLTARVDITGFVRKTQAEGGSLFNGVVYAIMTTANDIPEFRTRFRDDQVVEHETVHASYTVPLADELFGFCETVYVRDRDAFTAACTAATAAAREQLALGGNTTAADHWIYLSCLPWLDFTAVQHPVPNSEDCIPRIAWGKITEKDGRWSMPVNLQAHHALMDGHHAAKFYDDLATCLNRA